MATATKVLEGRVRNVTVELQEITAEVERRSTGAGDTDPQVLAILSEMETRIEQAVIDARAKMRRLDIGRPS